MRNAKDSAFATYLADHLAGSIQAIELIDNICANHRDDELGRFASQLKEEVKSDQETLRTIADAVGTGTSSIKEKTAWIAEKLMLIKLDHKSNSGLGVIEALEFLELGIHGKWALWRALGEIAPSQPALSVIDFRQLEARAAAQRDQVEEQRMKLVRKIFASSASTGAA
jgi:hypothetical protein